MRNGSIREIGICLLAAVMLAAPAISAGGQNAGATASAAGGRSIAMLPMANQSGDAQATTDIIPIIIRTLKDAGIGIITPDELRPVLRKHRIRAVGMVGRDGAEAVASESGAEFLLIGSLDFYLSGDNPGIGYSLHLLHVPEMIPFWAVSISASGSESIGLLGLGGIGRVDSLTMLLTSKVADQISGAVEHYPSAGVSGSSPIIAIVPFDDIDQDQPIGAVASAYMLTQLVRDGIRIVEPGVARETFLEMNRAPRGEIDHGLIDLLHDSLDVDFVITGAVDNYSVTATGAGGIRADISLGARLIDATSHRIEYAPYVIKHSETGSGLLSGGSDYPPADVITEAISDVVRKFAISSLRVAADSR